ncbi:hypothetical protein E2C01_021462 [Portunus trituberculatus]|uniref:Uncharacterized protein n=1 Tax=Portunus trituberculatus TaxID=210409 RepID=A0A5B7E4P9_PORTR|nr:hypothetical protein [Portunus trituberculatus]
MEEEEAKEEEKEEKEKGTKAGERDEQDGAGQGGVVLSHSIISLHVTPPRREGKSPSYPRLCSRTQQDLFNCRLFV